MLMIPFKTFVFNLDKELQNNIKTNLDNKANFVTSDAYQIEKHNNRIYDVIEGFRIRHVLINNATKYVITTTIVLKKHNKKQIS